jgi:16S rRNA (cytosine1402-N4)-methyltransferase
MEHVPVLLKEVLEVLMPRDGGKYFDGTLGNGGHARALLEAGAPGGELAATDLDANAVARISKEFALYGNRSHLFQTSYSNIDHVCADLGWKSLDGILLDLGVSSMELDDEARGFSFSRTGPLDMRFSQDSDLDAGRVVNTYDEQRLAHIIFTYGEERFSRRIARRIVERRPIVDTTSLADAISSAIPRKFWPKKIHPATKTFQAIRMEVNAELDNLREFLPKAYSLLSPGGVLAIISFHSLEDRMVKQFFAGPRHKPEQIRGLPIMEKTPGLSLERLTKKPIMASDEEILINPRARSARLRAARRVS